MGLLSNCQACCGQLVKIPTTLDPYGLFGPKFAYLFILILSSHWYQNGGEGLPKSCRVVRPFSEMLITLEPHGIF